MERSVIERLWSETLATPTVERFDQLARGVVDLHASGDVQFQQHVRNRFNRVTERTGKALDTENFDLETARAFVADELGFGGWDELIDAVGDSSADARPILFLYAIAAMDRGDFSALEERVGGPELFHSQIVDWCEKGLFNNEQETLDEVLSASCMLGQTKTAEYLIDKGVDPYAGMRSWLAGPHYAVSSGRLETVKMLLGKNIPMEIENRYGGTLLGQALWSAINEHRDDHAEIIERLIQAGAHVWPGTLDWWEAQEVPSPVTKKRVANALKNTV
jgi:hypothetical protein